MSVAKPSVHIVGVGGAGMSGVARFLHEEGWSVSGSDANDSSVLRELEDAGVVVYRGHDQSHGAHAELVLWSPAVAPENGEIQSARDRGARLLTRGEFLAEVAQRFRVVGLTGTHGKSTATSMMVTVSRAAGRDDARLLGTPVRGVGANGHYGSGDLILEVDESFGTLGLLSPFALGLLNVEADHLDHYGTVESLEEAFVALLERTSGPVVVFDEPGARRVAARARRDAAIVSFDEGSTWWVTDIALDRRTSRFALVGHGVRLEIALRVTGRHNVANAAIVAALAREVGISDDAIIKGLGDFEGAPRRFEFVGSWRGIDVIDDYAHLPGEVRATIAAGSVAGYRRIAVVFQPHRYTRTEKLANDFAHAFEGASLLIVTDVYGAGESNTSHVSGDLIARAVRSTRPSFLVQYAPTFDEVIAHLEEVGEGLDLLLVLGAGDVGTIVSMLPGGIRS
jgi:UDP-N-acetylmuramate--alanine ligase